MAVDGVTFPSFIHRSSPVRWFVTVSSLGELLSVPRMRMSVSSFRTPRCLTLNCYYHTLFPPARVHGMFALAQRIIAIMISHHYQCAPERSQGFLHSSIISTDGYCFRALEVVGIRFFRCRNLRGSFHLPSRIRIPSQGWDTLDVGFVLSGSWKI